MNKSKLHNTHFKPADRGFTLVEVIVVVAILGIIAAIAIPMYQNYIASSKQGAAQTSLEQFGVLLESYRAERGSYPSDGTYRYTEDNVGGVTTDNFRLPVGTAIFPDFKPRPVSASTTNFHYKMIVTNATKSTEFAVVTIIHVDHASATGVANATGTFR